MGARFSLPLRHEGRHGRVAGAQALARHPEIAIVHTNPQALGKKFVPVGFLS
jgi:hypothetical protein